MTTPIRAAVHGLAAILILAGSPAASAVTPETVMGIIGNAAEVEPPTQASTDFQKWAFATMIMSAAECWMAAYPGAALPPLLKSYPMRAGTYAMTAPGNLEAMCTALATQPVRPWCSSAVVQGDRSRPDSKLMRDYLQMERYSAPVKVTGGLYCHMNEYQGARQFFSPDKFMATWVTAPEPRSFTLPQGERVLKAGTIVVQVPTAPGQNGEVFQQPLTAVVP